jgi:hypothetical protein
MAVYREATPDQAELLDALVAAGHLIPSGVPGVYGRGSDFEAIRVGLDAHVTRVATAAGETPETLRFPPVLPRKQLRTSATWRASRTWRAPSSPSRAPRRRRAPRPSAPARTRTGPSTSA